MPKNSLPYRVASGSSSKWPKIVALIKQNFQAQHCQFHSVQNDVTCYCSHIINKNILRFLFMCIIACVASVSARVRRERRDESKKKKRNDGGGERRIVFRFHSNFRAITRLETLATHAMCIKMNDLYRVTKSS